MFTALDGKGENGNIAPTQNKKTVLVIEDQELLLSLLQDELTAVGHRALVGTTGEEGLRVLEEAGGNVALIFLDLILPKMDGFAVLKQLKSDSRFKDIPVVVLSNLGEEENIKRATELGAVEYFIKADMTPEKVIEIVNRVAV